MTNRQEPDRADVDALLARVPGPDAATVRRLATSPAARDLAEDIVSTPPNRKNPVTSLRVRLVLTAAATIGAVVLGHGALPEAGERAERDDSIAPALGTAPRTGAERVLVSRGGWTVIRIDESAPDDGEMTFAHGDGTLEVNWRPARYYQSYLDDRREGRPPSAAHALGQDGEMFAYSDSDFSTILPPRGDYYFEIRGHLGEDSYRDVLAALRVVSDEEWQAALPPSAVRVADRDAVITQMLDGIPLPAGWSREDIPGDRAVQERYQLGAAVMSSVACGWLGVWADAKEDGRQERADDATAAIRDSREWPVLKELGGEGGWSQAVEEAGRLMGDGDFPEFAKYPPGTSRVQAVRSHLSGALGCGEGETPAALRAQPAPGPVQPTDGD